MHHIFPREIMTVLSGLQLPTSCVTVSELSHLCLLICKNKELTPSDHQSFFHLELQAMGLLLTTESLFSTLLKKSNNVYLNTSFLDGKMDHPNVPEGLVLSRQSQLGFSFRSYLDTPGIDKGHHKSSYTSVICEDLTV